jgi:hypothetical protein
MKVIYMGKIVDRHDPHIRRKKLWFRIFGREFALAFEWRVR